jgi:hypothetical protein
MSQAIKKIGINHNFSQKVAWTIFSLLLLALLAYGLSFFLVPPQVETITTNPTNSSTSNNSYLNQTQDIRFQKQTRRNSK